MPRKRTSRIWKLPSEELQIKLNTMSSLSEVLRSFGYITLSGNYNTLMRRLREEDFDLSKLEVNRRKKQNKALLECNEKPPIEEILIQDSSAHRGHLKKRLIDEKILEYKCKECENDGEWRGKPIVLQLEHINGVCNDNRLENLCFLCPNCHSQTNTFAGKQRKKIHNCECGTVVVKKGSKCNKCAHKTLFKFHITKEELYDLVHIQKLPFTTIGRRFGVTDNSIRKRCKRLGVSVKRT